MSLEECEGQLPKTFGSRVYVWWCHKLTVLIQFGKGLIGNAKPLCEPVSATWHRRDPMFRNWGGKKTKAIAGREKQRAHIISYRVENNSKRKLKEGSPAEVKWMFYDAMGGDVLMKQSRYMKSDAHFHPRFCWTRRRDWGRRAGPVADFAGSRDDNRHVASRPTAKRHSGYKKASDSRGPTSPTGYMRNWSGTQPMLLTVLSCRDNATLTFSKKRTPTYWRCWKLAMVTKKNK